MTISSRTPEGEPNGCPVCGNRVHIDPSNPANDAPCPHCGHLLWFRQRLSERLGAEASQITAETSLIEDLAADSLDVVELVLEFEEEFEIGIPDGEYERIRTVGDVLAYVEQQILGVAP